MSTQDRARPVSRSACAVVRIGPDWRAGPHQWGLVSTSCLRFERLCLPCACDQSSTSAANCRVLAEGALTLEKSASEVRMLAAQLLQGDGPMTQLRLD